MDERRIYYLTCSYIERVQEEMAVVLSVSEWEAVVDKITSDVKSLIRTAQSVHSASPKQETT